MSKPFLEQLESFIDLEDFVELQRCEFKVAEMLKNYGRVVAEMEEHKDSFLWNDTMALAIHKDLKKLKALVKRVDTLYKKTAKQKKKEQNELRDTAMSGEYVDTYIYECNAIAAVKKNQIKVAFIEFQKYHEGSSYLTYPMTSAMSGMGRKG